MRGFARLPLVTLGLLLAGGGAASEAQTGCARPAEISASAWNALSAETQALACRTFARPAPVAPMMPAATTPTCGRACGEPWTPADFAASQRELERLNREIADLNGQMAALSRSTSSPPRGLAARRSTRGATASLQRRPGLAVYVLSGQYRRDRDRDEHEAVHLLQSF